MFGKYDLCFHLLWNCRVKKLNFWKFLFWNLLLLEAHKSLSMNMFSELWWYYVQPYHRYINCPKSVLNSRVFLQNHSESKIMNNFVHFDAPIFAVKHILKFHENWKFNHFISILFHLYVAFQYFQRWFVSEKVPGMFCFWIWAQLKTNKFVFKYPKYWNVFFQHPIYHFNMKNWEIMNWVEMRNQKVVIWD